MRNGFSRHGLALATLALLGGCAGSAAEPPPRPEPESDPGPTLLGVEAAPPAPPEEPELTLEDRWRAPFAVRSSGRVAARPPRTIPVARSASESRGEGVHITGNEAGSVRTTSDGPGVAIATGADGRSDAPAATGAAADARSADAAESGAPGPDAPGADDSAAGDGVRTHRVEWGETWLGLARRYGLRSAQLAALNPGVDPERLRAGEVLRVPLAEAPDGRRTHTVVVGDSLWGISRRYGVSIERLREVNRLEGDRVRIGQVLVIPG